MKKLIPVLKKIGYTAYYIGYIYFVFWVALILANHLYEHSEWLDVSMVWYVIPTTLIVFFCTGVLFLVLAILPLKLND